MDIDNKSRLFTVLERAISSERLIPYKRLGNGNIKLAIDYYVYNMRLAAALYVPIQGIEILVRNAFNYQLVDHFGEKWFNNPKLALKENLSLMLSKSKLICIKRKRLLTISSLIPELSFGFWVGLLGNHYETHLWRPCIYHAFRHASKPFRRERAHKNLLIIQQLRNRIAHHEPILSKELIQKYQLIIETASWICPTSALWIGNINDFQTVLHNRPEFYQISLGSEVVDANSFGN